MTLLLGGTETWWQKNRACLWLIKKFFVEDLLKIEGLLNASMVEELETTCWSKYCVKNRGLNPVNK